MSQSSVFELQVSWWPPWSHGRHGSVRQSITPISRVSSNLHSNKPIVILWLKRHKIEFKIQQSKLPLIMKPPIISNINNNKNQFQRFFQNPSNTFLLKVSRVHWFFNCKIYLYISKSSN